jgi:S-adenosylmethionine hydrolase
MSVVAFITDFGTADWFVGSMKAALFSIDRGLQIVDITHEVPAGDVRAGAFVLLSSYRDFPPGTVFVAVVDPGVGSQRRALVAAGDGYGFVGPDNGLLSLALSRVRKLEVRMLENPLFVRRQISATFHGRDVFAPAAAHLASYLAKSRPIEPFGPVAADYLRLPWPEPEVEAGRVRGRVVYIDRFGNAITSIKASLLADQSLLGGRVSCPACGSIPLCSFYEQAGEGESLAVIGSSGFMEIAVNRGSAASRLGLKIGDPVEVVEETGAPNR